MKKFTFLYLLVVLSYINTGVALELVIKGKNTAQFDVKVARTPKEQAQGLMYVKSMPVNMGMLFLFEQEKEVYFWMKNTYIPLDIIFFDKDNMIVKIVKNTIPFSEKTLASDVQVKGALEVNAGIIDKYKIRVGDKVQF